jgi:hypothetical protein
LSKRRAGPSTGLPDLLDVVKYSDQDKPQVDGYETDLLPEPKRIKTLTVEEYEAALDNDFAYDNLPA